MPLPRRAHFRDFLARLGLAGTLVPEEPTLPQLAENHARFAERDRQAFHARLLEDIDFAVLDTELTGMDPARDEIVSIGAVRVRGLRLDPRDGFYALARPEAEQPRVATLIHRLTPEMLRAAPPVAEVLPGLLDWLGDSLIVGHHVGLDMAFLNRALRRHYGAGLRTPCLDTMRLAQAFQEDRWENRYDAFNLKISYNLAALAETYGLPKLPAHNAWADALQAAYLFLFLVRKLRSGRLRTLHDLHQTAKPRRFL
ncbi:MAG: PolC-type DNA polymerase III [Desulfovibrionaceae bacterium]